MLPPLASELSPLRHCGNTLAPTPTGDYAPRASHFHGAQRVRGGAGPELDGIAAIQFPLILGIVLGAAYSAAMLGELRIYWRVPLRQCASAVIGGAVMGAAARMAPACNVWHLLGGLPILAAQSLLFVLGMLPGAWLGSRLLTRFVLRP